MCVCGGGGKRAAQPGPAELPGAAALPRPASVPGRESPLGERGHAQAPLARPRPSSALPPGAAPRPRGSTAAECSGLQASGRAATPRRPPPASPPQPALWGRFSARRLRCGRFSPCRCGVCPPGDSRGVLGAAPEPPRRAAAPAALFPVLPPRKCASRASGRLPRPRAPGAPARCGGGGGASLAQRPSRSCPPSLSSQTCRRAEVGRVGREAEPLSGPGREHLGPTRWDRVR